MIYGSRVRRVRENTTLCSSEKVRQLWNNGYQKPVSVMLAPACKDLVRVPGVYFIQQEDGPVKIGRAMNISARLAALQTASPYELRCRMICESKDPVRIMALEKTFHEHFAGCRIRGEWFRPGMDLGVFMEDPCSYFALGSLQDAFNIILDDVDSPRVFNGWITPGVYEKHYLIRAEDRLRELRDRGCNVEIGKEEATGKRILLIKPSDSFEEDEWMYKPLWERVLELEEEIIELLLMEQEQDLLLEEAGFQKFSIVGEEDVFIEPVTGEEANRQYALFLVEEKL